jgi:hypothetical protein
VGITEYIINTSMPRFLSRILRHFFAIFLIGVVLLAYTASIYAERKGVANQYVKIRTTDIGLPAWLVLSKHDVSGKSDLFSEAQAKELIDEYHVYSPGWHFLAIPFLESMGWIIPLSIVLYALGYVGSRRLSLSCWNMMANYTAAAALGLAFGLLVGREIRWISPVYAFVVMPVGLIFLAIYFQSYLHAVASGFLGVSFGILAIHFEEIYRANHLDLRWHYEEGTITMYIQAILIFGSGYALTSALALFLFRCFRRKMDGLANGHSAKFFRPKNQE